MLGEALPTSQEACGVLKRRTRGQGDLFGHFKASPRHGVQFFQEGSRLFARQRQKEQRDHEGSPHSAPKPKHHLGPILHVGPCAQEGPAGHLADRMLIQEALGQGASNMDFRKETRKHILLEAQISNRLFHIVLGVCTCWCFTSIQKMRGLLSGL